MAIETSSSKGGKYTVLKPFRVKRDAGSRGTFQAGKTVTLSDADAKDAVAAGVVQKAELADFTVLLPLIHDGVKYKKGSTVTLSSYEAKSLLASKTVAAVLAAPAKKK
jgi:hypothetical protein